MTMQCARQTSAIIEQNYTSTTQNAALNEPSTSQQSPSPLHCHSHVPPPQANAHYSDSPGNYARPHGRKHRSQCKSDSDNSRTRTCSTRSRLQLVWDARLRPHCRSRLCPREGKVPSSRNTASSASRERAARGLLSSCGVGRGGGMSAPGAWIRLASDRTSDMWRANCRLWLCSASTSIRRG